MVWMSFPSDREWREKRRGTTVAEFTVVVREDKGVCEFAGAATAKCHVLNGLHIEMDCLTVLEARSPSARC